MIQMNTFPEPNVNENEFSKISVLLKYDDILSLYNSGLKTKEVSVTDDVVKWVYSEAIRHGWKYVWWPNDGYSDRCCWLSLDKHKSITKLIEEKTFNKILSGAFTKIAQHACRLGESGKREWPSLEDLPELDSWKMVGEKYAKELAIEIMKLYFDKGKFLEGLAKTAAKES